MPAEDPSLAKIKVPSGVYQVGKPRPKESHKPEEDLHRLTTSSRQPFESPSTPYLQGLQPASVQYYDERFPEDQRVIRMLNSQHII